MALAHLGLAFTAGFMATLAPCALPMLPSYIAYYLNLDEERNLSRSLIFSVTTVIGFLTLYILIGLLPSVIVNRIASRLDLVIPFIGGFLILVGLMNVFSNLTDRIPMLSLKAPEKSGISSFYIYGLGYGAASLSCSFPVFILLVLQSASAGGPLDVIIMFLVYGLGAAAMIVPLTLALSYSKEVIYSRLMEYLPYVKKANSVILIIAGLYMIYYSYVN
jgi:cytochrome c biogenesis protein CcdA